MSFNPGRIVIHGVGLLGGSLGLALKNGGYTGRIVGVSSEKSLALALGSGCIDEGFPYQRFDEAVKDGELIMLCTPVNTIKSAITDLSRSSLREGTVITDVGSTKREIVEHAATLLPRTVSFVGGHPMAGSEKSGVAAAVSHLFRDAVYVITPPGGVPTAVELNLAAFLERYLGCRVLFLDPATHDRIVAAVSHVPYLLAVALRNAVSAEEKAFPGTCALAATGFRDMTRLAASSPAMWRDILETNRAAIDRFLDVCITELQNMKTRLRKNDFSHLLNGAGPMPAKGTMSPC